MAPPANTDSIDFSAEQRQTLTSLAGRLRLVSLLLFLLALLRLVTGALILPTFPFPGVASLLEGVLTGVLGVVMLTGADDAQFLVQRQGIEKPHLVHTFASLSKFYQIQIALGIVVGALLVLQRPF